MRKLTDFERTGMGAVFPSDWEMGRRLAKEFCALTAYVLFSRFLLFLMISRKKVITIVFQ